MSANTNKTKKGAAYTGKAQPATALFRRRNVLIFLLAGFMVSVGFIMMAGEATTETAFCQDIFSSRCIVIAPLLSLMGYLLVIVGIVWRFDK